MRALLLAFALGCDTDDWQPASVSDAGTACLVTDGTGGTQSFDVDTPITVAVTFDTCLSSSCSRNPSTHCDATVEGDAVTITAEASWEENRGNVSCTLDCGILTAECQLGTLPEGLYTVSFGGESFDLTVPGSQEACAEAHVDL